MKILVLNGSPKGKYSVTLQTVRYLQVKFPEHSFGVIHAAQKIRGLEKDLSPVLERIAQADLILFSYPVYTFLAPSQLHKLIRLMKESGVDFSGKYVTQLTTSKHFYDMTAHRYILENCQDMRMKVIQGLSADMDDLLSEKGQKEAEDFLRYVCWSVEHDQYEPLPSFFHPVPSQTASVPEKNQQEKNGEVVIVTDCREEDTQLQAMIQRFRAVCPHKTRVVNLRNFPFQGGCLGCMQCGATGNCIYKDGFEDFLRGDIQSAQATVYAFSIQDHSMGPLFKCYDDRQFCNGHRAVTMGTPVGYLVSGPYSREQNLQTVIEARAQVGGNFLAGVATDEVDTDGGIDRMAARLSYGLEHSYAPPPNFYGVGGMKIFRDLIWLMQGFMKEDHKFYKEHGQYDFPQKKMGTMLGMYLVGGLMGSPAVKGKGAKYMRDGMLAPYHKVLAKVQKETM
ncbi:MAG: NAD(P)H-dependent oxidoreductase [Ruminiclostridium sp.]|nr:NAD(P)H-dependent oxidoreductase [Ruminiclostridium sp.]